MALYLCKAEKEGLSEYVLRLETIVLITNHVTAIARTLPYLPATLTHLNISIEATYSREVVSPSLWRKIYPETHICLELAKALPLLESLTYTGRICHQFFIHAARLSERDRGGAKLKSLSLIVKNCCRPHQVWNDGTGIADYGFITAFESLVHEGVRSLDRLSRLRFLSIRYIDLGKFCMQTALDELS